MVALVDEEGNVHLPKPKTLIREGVKVIVLRRSDKE